MSGTMDEAGVRGNRIVDPGAPVAGVGLADDPSRSRPATQEYRRYASDPSYALRRLTMCGIAGIIRLDPGASPPRREQTLDWRTRTDDLDDEAASGRVRELLGAAVERRLVTDVPLGAFLSGGIDSTLIVGLMRERIEGPVRTFSLGFAGELERA